MALLRVEPYIVDSVGNFVFSSATVTSNVTAGNVKTDNLLYANGASYKVSSFTNDTGYLVAANLTSYATQTYVGNEIANLVASAPAALDTLNELANALGNDASFSTTITNQIAGKLSSSEFNSTANTWLTLQTTSNVSEGTNLYYTVGRANTAIDNRVTKTFVDNLGVNANTLNGHSDTYFATSTQGSLADSAVQPGDLATVATTGSYTDLLNTPTLFDGEYSSLANKPTLFDGTYANLTGLPTLGTAAATDSTAYATAAQGAKADTALQSADLTDYATETYVDSAISARPVSDITVDSFTGDGTTTDFTLSVSPANVNLVTVNYNGATLLRNTYTISGTTISFVAPPASGLKLEATTINTVTVAGNLSIADVTIDGNIIPSANITYDLGSPTNRFKDLYLSGTTIDLAGATITTDATTGAIALVPSATLSNPNPTALVITATGALSTVTTTGGNVTTSQISNAVANTTVDVSTPSISINAYANVSAFPSVDVVEGSMAFALDTSIMYIRTSNNWVAIKSSTPQYVNLNQPGPITTPVTGTARFYPKGNITISNVYAYLGTPSSTNLTFNIYKNGSNVGLYTINANAYTMSVASANISMTSSDYLTLNIASGTGASDLKVDLQY